MKENRKICILGYDALEIDLVEKFDLPNLKQDEYGKIDISDFETVYTPILWGSFLTGENLEPHFREDEGSKLLQKFFHSPYKFIKKNVSGKIAVSLKRHLKNLGVVGKVEGNVSSKNVAKDLEKETILDLVEKSKAINVPSLNRNRSKESSMKDRIEGKTSDSEYQKSVWACFEDTKRKLLENLDRELVMAWFGLADWMGHVYRGDMDEMRKTYEALDDFAGEVKRRFDGLVLIVADHGMNQLGSYGDHTDMNYGYYSSSIELGLKHPKMTEFYDIIEGIITGNFDPRKYSHEELGESEDEEDFEGDEEEEIKKRLEELGYFD
ncbi:MAG: alkaline phosphatase family protein [Candidatus Hadarchaeota archaeon]